jgi:hypothetical protein
VFSAVFKRQSNSFCMVARVCFINKSGHRWRSPSDTTKGTGPALPSTARAAGPPPPRPPWPSTLSRSRWPGLFMKHTLKPPELFPWLVRDSEGKPVFRKAGVAAAPVELRRDEQSRATRGDARRREARVEASRGECRGATRTAGEPDSRIIPA